MFFSENGPALTDKGLRGLGPMRLAAALGDLMAAAFVWLAARQISPRK